MMWNWFSKMLGKDSRPKRKKVLVDIPYEQHSFSLDNFSRTRPKYDVNETSTSDVLDESDTTADMDIANK